MPATGRRWITDGNEAAASVAHRTSANVVDYMRNEGRFRMVEKANPERFKMLARAAQREARQRFAVYQQLAGITIPRIEEAAEQAVLTAPVETGR